MDVNKYLNSYAVVDFGGKQYQAVVGTLVAFEKIEQEPGSKFVLDKVLLLKRADGDVLVGKPLVNGASVVTEVVSQTKGPKLTVFRYKRRKRVRTKRGHRQQHTVLRILELKS